MDSRPEQTFFEDPAVDRAIGMIMVLAAELYVARDHNRVLESLLVDKGILDADEVARFVPNASQAAAWETERDAFVAALMANVEGRSVGSHA
ncbi:MAG: hypothetical protein HOI95_20810 [Chromatiales bacterium]|jgi:hypothetical protein|nr:hypothetical protein [Chromatiales bacterium]